MSPDFPAHETEPPPTVAAVLRDLLPRRYKGPETALQTVTNRIADQGYKLHPAKAQQIHTAPSLPYRRSLLTIC